MGFPGQVALQNGDWSGLPPKWVKLERAKNVFFGDLAFFFLLSEGNYKEKNTAKFEQFHFLREENQFFCESELGPLKVRHDLPLTDIEALPPSLIVKKMLLFHGNNSVNLFVCFVILQ